MRLQTGSRPRGRDRDGQLRISCCGTTVWLRRHADAGHPLLVDGPRPRGPRRHVRRPGRPSDPAARHRCAAPGIVVAHASASGFPDVARPARAPAQTAACTSRERRSSHHSTAGVNHPSHGRASPRSCRQGRACAGCAAEEGHEDTCRSVRERSGRERQRGYAGGASVCADRSITVSTDHDDRHVDVDELHVDDSAAGEHAGRSAVPVLLHIG